MTARDVFLTGATGYWGRPLAAGLLSRGHVVRALVRRPSSDTLLPGAELIVGDALSAPTFAYAVPPADTLVHLVGVSRPSPLKARAFREVDLVSVRASIDAATVAGVEHFVYLSVAHPAPVMRAFVRARQEGEAYLRDDPEIRVVLLRGAGQAFCTGIDLKELSSGGTPLDYFEQWDRGLRIIERTEKFYLCGMHGYAFGGGLQLALVSDIPLATEDCQLGLPAIEESIVPGLAPFRLGRYIGLGRAKWMILSGENVDGRRAHDMGLVDHLVPSDEFGDQVEAMVTKYLRTCSAGARQSKALLALADDLSQPEFFEEYLRRQADCIADPDHAEAKAAYRQERDPKWR